MKKYSTLPKWNRGAAWIGESQVYHCGLECHAKVFQDVYRGDKIDSSTVKSYLSDIWKAVHKTNWIRVFEGNYDVKCLNTNSLRRIKDFLLENPYYIKDDNCVSDSTGLCLSFSASDIDELPERIAFAKR